MRKLYFYALVAISLAPIGSFAQASNVGIGTLTPDPSALLDLTSTGQGLLAPRLTTAQRLAITTPADGLLVYDVTAECFYYYNATTSAWVSLCQAASTPTSIIHAVSGTTDINTTSTSYVSTGTTLTFTSVKPNLLVSFTLAGYTDATFFPDAQNVSGRILLDGTSIGGTITSGVSYDPSGDDANGFNLAFSKLVTGVAAGPHTLTLEWEIQPAVTATTIYCLASSGPDYEHNTISAIEF